MTARETVALRPPGTDSSDFPNWRLRRDRRLFRAHQALRSPWWFCSDMACRFDVAAPAGTCYLALDTHSALRERLGQRLVRVGFVPAEELETVVVSRLSVPAGRRLADCCDPRAANHGLTREIATIVPYDLPQRWARAWSTAGYGGVRYEARFSTAARPNAVALFGTAGVADWPADPHPRPGHQVALDAGLQVLSLPRSRRLRILQPPERR